MPLNNKEYLEMSRRLFVIGVLREWIKMRFEDDLHEKTHF